jgi:hypothetical protein
MCFDTRTRALLSELDDLQSARSRVFTHMLLLTDMVDPQAFCDVLADVAALHARVGSRRRREEWELLVLNLDRALREMARL